MNSDDMKIDKRHLRTIRTREKLLVAAREVFLENDFQTTTISQIIKRAGVGYGTAYVHFEGKDELLIVLIETVMDQFHQVAEQPFEPRTAEEAREQIEQQATAFLQLAEQERELLRIVEQAIGVSYAIRTKWKQIRERFIERISRDIRYAQATGLARSDLNPTLVARGWFFANEMYLFEVIREETTATIDEIAKTLTAVYTTGLYPHD
ncbi:TetR/AcrR family transcriptional regulator [Exiguobacterium sp. RIT452]|jgi:AcrR family transcriptional regulator|uniref:TetR family transcriptional regulator n=1 Tax=Exiguobacterium undae TaxID=169177 RepID=A0ABX2V5P7_9BACL|nr:MULTISPECIES: TetR/AcrR family transcriptional regulator [Exiguobacterium]OAN10414.1 TetR family transcriptional regulator [Exiguobacterium undae]RJO96876.1 TetR/AcrR family transcriptional regulator [Exiguobacterium sp. RIT452]